MSWDNASAFFSWRHATADAPAGKGPIAAVQGSGSLARTAVEMSNHVMGAEMILKRVGIAVLLTASSLLLVAQQDSQSIIAAIKAEGLRSTQAAVVFHTLTDTIGPRLRMVPREAHGGDDCAALHAADRICRGMVCIDIRRPDRHARLHRRQHRCRYRSPRPSPARLHCAHASSTNGISPQRSAAAVRGKRSGGN